MAGEVSGRSEILGEVKPGMHAVKLLHMADMHLEWPFTGLGLDSHRGRLRREELKEVFASIIDLAIQEQVELFLIAGDLFEHRHLTRATLHFLAEQFRRIPTVRVFISPGNHDPGLPDSYYWAYPWPENVHIFGSRLERVDLPELQTSVYGWGFGAWEERQNQLDSFHVADEQRLNLLVVHGGQEPYHPFRPVDLAATGADYIALGHIHKRGVLLKEGGRVIAQYSGSPEALSFGEPGDHGVYVGTLSKKACDLRFVPTGRREFITLDLDLSQITNPEALLEAILALESESRRQQHCYRIHLVGSLDPDLPLDLPLLEERLGQHFFLLRLVDQTHPAWDLALLAKEQTARGLFVQRLLAMAEVADEAEQAKIRRALLIGLAAFQGG